VGSGSGARQPPRRRPCFRAVGETCRRAR
jgi:hypothetical protein